ncbi:hypothetical protein [Porcipelethomonas sp.]
MAQSIGVAPTETTDCITAAIGVTAVKSRNTKKMKEIKEIEI